METNVPYIDSVMAIYSAQDSCIVYRLLIVVLWCLISKIESFKTALQAKNVDWTSFELSFSIGIRLVYCLL